MSNDVIFEDVFADGSSTFFGEFLSAIERDEMGIVMLYGERASFREFIMRKAFRECREKEGSKVRATAFKGGLRDTLVMSSQIPASERKLGPDTHPEALFVTCVDIVDTAKASITAIVCSFSKKSEKLRLVFSTDSKDLVEELQKELRGEKLKIFDCSSVPVAYEDLRKLIAYRRILTAAEKYTPEVPSLFDGTPEGALTALSEVYKIHNRNGRITKHEEWLLRLFSLMPYTFFSEDDLLRIIPRGENKNTLGDTLRDLHSCGWLLGITDKAGNARYAMEPLISDAIHSVPFDFSRYGGFVEATVRTFLLVGLDEGCACNAALAIMLSAFLYRLLDGKGLQSDAKIEDLNLDSHSESASSLIAFMCLTAARFLRRVPPRELCISEQKYGGIIHESNASVKRHARWRQV